MLVVDSIKVDSDSIKKFLAKMANTRPRGRVFMKGKKDETIPVIRLYLLECVQRAASSGAGRTGCKDHLWRGEPEPEQL